jgi:hypothetical protein
MVLNYWRTIFHSLCQYCSSPMVGDEVLGSPLAQSLSLGFRSENSLLEKAKKMGYSALGEMFNATQLAALASSIRGFRVALHANPSVGTIKTMLKLGRPLIVPFDVGSDGEPDFDNGSDGGERAHYAVLVGFVYVPGRGLVLLALHSWNLRDLHMWPWESFSLSWNNLHGTSFYGDSDAPDIPASLFTQGEAGLPKPQRMRLPPLLGRHAAVSTHGSLSGFLIEVVPTSLALLGTHEVKASLLF